MSRSGRNNEPSPLEIMIDNFATIAPWWLLFGIAIFMYFLFSFISGMKIEGNPLQHPFQFFLIAFSGFMKIFVPIMFCVAGIVSTFKQLSGKKSGGWGEQEAVPVKAQGPAKIATYKMAQQLGISTKEVYKIMAERGYIELRNGEHWLTAKGKEIGGECRTSEKVGKYFVWPENLKL